MSDAPKRIWARPADATARSFDGNLTGGWSVHKGYVSGPCEEYAPADELDRLRTENERLREALEKIASYLPMFDYVVNDDYGKPDLSKPGSPFDRGRAQEADHLSSIARAALKTDGGKG